MNNNSDEKGEESGDLNNSLDWMIRICEKKREKNKEDRNNEEKKKNMIITL